MNTQKQIILIVALTFIFVGGCAAYTAIDLPIRAEDQQDWTRDQSLERGAIVESVKRTNRLVIVEEAWPLASISSEIAYKVQRDAFDYLDAPVVRIASADVPLPYAATLLQAALPNVERVVKGVKEVMYIKK